MSKSKSKVPQLRKGLTRPDLLAGSWVGSPDHTARIKESPADAAALSAFNLVLDRFLIYVEHADRVTRKDVTSFFVALESFAGIRDVINHKITKGELTPGVLDKLVENV